MDENRTMDMVVTYEEVITILEARIEKKRKEIKDLKKELKKVQIEKNKEDYQRLIKYMDEHNIASDFPFYISEK